MRSARSRWFEKEGALGCDECECVDCPTYDKSVMWP